VVPRPRAEISSPQRLLRRSRSKLRLRHHLRALRALTGWRAWLPLSATCSKCFCARVEASLYRAKTCAALLSLARAAAAAALLFPSCASSLPLLAFHKLRCCDNAAGAAALCASCAPLLRSAACAWRHLQLAPCAALEPSQHHGSGKRVIRRQAGMERRNRRTSVVSMLYIAKSEKSGGVAGARRRRRGARQQARICLRAQHHMRTTALPTPLPLAEAWLAASARLCTSAHCITYHLCCNAANAMPAAISGRAQLLLPVWSCCRSAPRLYWLLYYLLPHDIWGCCVPSLRYASIAVRWRRRHRIWLTWRRGAALCHRHRRLRLFLLRCAFRRVPARWRRPALHAQRLRLSLHVSCRALV